MSCGHRFYNELIPQWKIEYLFIGTFNPEWNNSSNNVDYFYGRSKNQFWCILPNVFDSPCLIEKTKKDKINFCKSHKIGITDIIKSISNADERNDDHKKLILNGYRDTNLEKKENNEFIFELDFNTSNIIQLIEINKIKGIFFTRSTFNGIPRIRIQWNFLKQLSKNKFNTGELLTPSQHPIYGIKDKIEHWKEVIF